MTILSQISTLLKIVNSYVLLWCSGDTKYMLLKRANVCFVKLVLYTECSEANKDRLLSTYVTILKEKILKNMSWLMSENVETTGISIALICMEGIISFAINFMMSLYTSVSSCEIKSIVPG